LARIALQGSPALGRIVTSASVPRLLILLVLAGLAWPSAAGAKTVVGYMTRTEPLDVELIYPAIAKSYPNDPDRCVGFRMGEWARVKHALGYNVTFDPPPNLPGAYPVDAWVTDDAPFEVDGPMGKGTRVMRNPPPPTVFETSVGPITWPATVARAMIGWYSTPEGCAKALEVLQATPFTVRKATAKLSVPVKRMVRDRPPPKSEFDDAPKGAIMKVVEIDRGKLWRTRNGKKVRLRFGDYIKAGDVITISEGGAAAIEMITGGRIGFVGDQAVLVLSENQVENISDGELTKGLKKARAAWRKVSERKQPMGIETAGGVMGIKG
jgi:hypothetical protein